MRRPSSERQRPANGRVARRSPGARREAEIDDISRVRAILWALCDLGYEVSVSGPTGVVKGRMLQQAAIDRSRVPELRCQVKDADRLPLRSGAVTVECSLFGSGYRFYARITDRKADVLSLSPSPKLREWHRRDEERTPLGPRERGHRQLPSRADGRAACPPAHRFLFGRLLFSARRQRRGAVARPAAQGRADPAGGGGLQGARRWRSAPCRQPGERRDARPARPARPICCVSSSSSTAPKPIQLPRRQRRSTTWSPSTARRSCSARHGGVHDLGDPRRARSAPGG